MTRRQRNQVSNMVFSISFILYLLFITYHLDKQNFVLKEVIFCFTAVPILFFLGSMVVSLFIILIADLD